MCIRDSSTVDSLSVFEVDGYKIFNPNDCGFQKKQAEAIKKKFKDVKPPEFGQPCECCGKPVYRNWQLDHCHDTGDFRGWLCKQCNTGLGNLGDTLQSLKLAVEYLERAEQNANTSQQNYLRG